MPSLKPDGLANMIKPLVGALGPHMVQAVRTADGTKGWKELEGTGMPPEHVRGGMLEAASNFVVALLEPSVSTRKWGQGARGGGLGGWGATGLLELYCRVGVVSMLQPANSTAVRSAMMVIQHHCMYTGADSGCCCCCWLLLCVSLCTCSCSTASTNRAAHQAANSHAVNSGRITAL